MIDPADGLRIAARLGLAPLDREGGRFRRTYTSGSVTAIYYCLVAPDFSAMHRMRTSDELFLFHAGAPLRMLTLDERAAADAGPGRSDDPGREEVLGPDPLSGHAPQLLVPAGVWQGASSTVRGAWSPPWWCRDSVGPTSNSVIAAGWPPFFPAGPIGSPRSPADAAGVLTLRVRSEGVLTC